MQLMVTDFNKYFTGDNTSRFTGTNFDNAHNFSNNHSTNNSTFSNKFMLLMFLFDLLCLILLKETSFWLNKKCMVKHNLFEIQF